MSEETKPKNGQPPTETREETPDELTDRAADRLSKIETPLDTQAIVEMLRGQASLVFPPPGSQENPREQETMQELLIFFARNSWPLEPYEGKKNGVLKGSGGVRVEGHWRVTRPGTTFLLIKSSGRVNKADQLRELLEKMQVAADCTESIVTCLKQGRGPRLLVCSDDSIIMRASNSSREELLLEVFEDQFRVKVKPGEETGGRMPLDHLEELAHASVYPPQVEITFDEEPEE